MNFLALIMNLGWQLRLNRHPKFMINAEGSDAVAVAVEGAEDALDLHSAGQRG